MVSAPDCLILAVRVVLADDVDLLDRGLVLHERGQRLHLHGGVSVQPEVPEIALLVGQRRVHRSVVQVYQFFAGVALVVFLDRVGDGQSRAGAVALGDIAKALVNRGLERVQTFLGRALVVKAHHLELHPSGVLGAGKMLGGELPALELVLADVGKGAGKRVHEGDPHGLALLRQRQSGRGRHGGYGNHF
jgi:hypothetical protein